MENKEARIRASNLEAPQRTVLDDPLAVITDDVKAKVATGIDKVG